MAPTRIFAIAMAAVAVAASGLVYAQAAATPAEAVAYRQAHMRRVGATFKAISDRMRQSEPSLPALTSDAQALAALAQDVPNWFPANSAPPAGEKNRAKPEIWSDSARFGQEVARFQSATRDLAASSDIEGFRTNLRAIRPVCARCHDSFTIPD